MTRCERLQEVLDIVKVAQAPILVAFALEAANDADALASQLAAQDHKVSYQRRELEQLRATVEHLQKAAGPSPLDGLPEMVDVKS